jgi:hypothetical protein
VFVKRAPGFASSNHGSTPARRIAAPNGNPRSDRARHVLIDTKARLASRGTSSTEVGMGDAPSPRSESKSGVEAGFRGCDGPFEAHAGSVAR